MAATITVLCPNPQCQNPRMRASVEHIGRKGRCPSCGSLVDIIPQSGGANTITGGNLSPGARDTRAPGSTQVDAMLPGIIGAAATIALYLFLFWPLRGTYLGELMTGRGPIQYAITLVTCWGIAILFFKYLAVQKQSGFAEQELQFIPLEVGVQITGDNVDKFLDHLAGLPDEQRLSLIGRRIQGAIEHFKYRESVPEVQGYLSTQANIDASAVDGGYTLLRAFIWVCPILGFIGTVLGISAAVYGLKTSLTPDAPAAPAAMAQEEPGQPVLPAQPPSGDLKDRMLSGMGAVTDGLATAFDTTLLGLVCVIILLFPTESLRKSEYSVLDRIEAFTNESLLRRMDEGDGAGLAGNMPHMVAQTLQSAFQTHQQWLAQWQKEVGKLGELIGGDFELAVQRVVQHVSDEEAARVDRVQRGIQAIEDIFGNLSQSLVTLKQWDGQTAIALESSQQLQQALADNNRIFSSLLQQQQLIAERYFANDISQKIDELQSELRQMGQQLVIPAATLDLPASRVEPLHADHSGGTNAKRRGLFGLWGGHG